MYRQPHLIEPCTTSTEHYKTDSNTLCYVRIYSCAITIISVGRGERFQIPELFRVSNLKHTEVVTFLHICAVLQKKKWRSKERLDAPSICKCNVNVM